MSVEESNEDDLEFHITFPSPTPQVDSEFVVVSEESAPEPVVFLLGWAGCQDKHLAKYSTFYEQMGCITVRYTAPAQYIFFDADKIRPLARKLLDLISEMSLEENPIFFHAFSNNGCGVYQHMCQALTEDAGKTDPEYAGIETRIRGCIFDSGPGRRTALSFLRATQEVIAALTGSDQKASLFCYDYIKNEEHLTTPVLFLYSVKDEVIKHEDITEVADALAAKNECEVTKICYDDSPHVQHLRYHRESYIGAIRTFVQTCLRDAVKPTAD